MVDPKHRLGEMFFQPTFLSSISTVFSHQKVIPGMYIYIYMAFESLGHIVEQHPCQNSALTSTLLLRPSPAQGGRRILLTILTSEKCWYIMYVCFLLYIRLEFPGQTRSNNGTIDPYIWFLACFCIAKMVDPKHRLGEMSFQPTFLSSISTVFSHQKLTPAMYIHIYISIWHLDP